MDTITGVSSPDALTLVVRLTEPTGDLGYRFALPAMAPIHRMQMPGWVQPRDIRRTMDDSLFRLARTCSRDRNSWTSPFPGGSTAGERVRARALIGPGAELELGSRN